MKEVVRVPEDFLLALKADDYVYEFFMNLTPPHKKEYINWIDEAKKPETRARRIKEAVAMIREKQKEGRYLG